MDEWLWQGTRTMDLALKENSLGSEGGQLSNAEFMNKTVKAVLLCLPQVVPFSQRVSLFQTLLASDRSKFQNDFAGFGVGQVVRLQIRRSFLLEDSFEALHSLGSQLKGKIQVNFVSDQGVPEAGIDGGM